MSVDWPALLRDDDVRTLVSLALREDIGSGDATTTSVFDRSQPAVAQIVARADTVVCGLPLAAEIFSRVEPTLSFESNAAEGQLAGAGTTVATVRGDIRGVLTAERCALNFLMRLCGVADATRRATNAIPGDCNARIYDTRKTTPGWRLLEKAAVRTGGAENHRQGLFDAVLIKDNHVAAAGSVGQAIRRARAGTDGLVIEVEIDGLDQLEGALAESPDIILLDNFSAGEMRQAVERVAGAVILEASGGITLDTIADVARTGVDRISMGAITHSAIPADLALDIES